jgi:hypothetical protein
MNTGSDSQRFDVAFRYGCGARFGYGLDPDNRLGPAMVGIHWLMS